MPTCITKRKKSDRPIAFEGLLYYILRFFYGKLWFVLIFCGKSKFFSIAYAPMYTAKHFCLPETEAKVLHICIIYLIIYLFT